MAPIIFFLLHKRGRMMSKFQAVLHSGYSEDVMVWCAMAPYVKLYIRFHVLEEVFLGNMVVAAQQRSLGLLLKSNLL